MAGEDLQPVHRPGQADVAQDDVGRQGLDQPVGRDLVAGRPHDGHVGLISQERGQPFGDGRVVLDDRQADHAPASGCGRAPVPDPGFAER